MATTVDDAFAEFMRNTVDLDPQTVKDARKSRDNLLENIDEFDNTVFFNLVSRYNVHFGSFSRKTKCRELDDIDLMIGISAEGATYYTNNSWNNIAIKASKRNSTQIECSNSDGTLNSTKVLNRFKRKLENVREYSRSDIKRCGEAVVLNLRSKAWSFDIIPCFHTTEESDGRAYYLIPNGNGAWKKTEPTIEQNVIARVNNRHSQQVVNTIRLIKYWNKRRQMPTMSSYVLETMIVNYFDEISETYDWIDMRFSEGLNYIARNIWNPVYDSKNIEGNINTLSYQEKANIQERAKSDYNNTCSAITADTTEKNQLKAINIWRNILGEDFPTYG